MLEAEEAAERGTEADALLDAQFLHLVQVVPVEVTVASEKAAHDGTNL